MVRFFVKNKKLSLVMRLFLLFTFSAIVSIFFVNLFSTLQIEKVIERMATMSSQQSAEMFNYTVDVLLNDAMNTIKLGTDPAVYEFLRSKTSEDIYQSSKQLGTVYKNARTSGVSKAQVIDVTIIGANGNCISERNGFFVLDADFYEYSFSSIVQQDPYTVHVISEPQKLTSTARDYDAISLLQAITTLSTNQILGIIRVDVDRNLISDLLDSTLVDSPGSAIIVDYSGQEIIPYTNGKFMIPKAYIQKNIKDYLPNGHSIIKVNSQNYLLTYNKLNNFDWILLQAYPVEALKNSPISEIRYIILAVVFIGIFLLILINFTISNTVVKPIIRLRELMHSVKNGQIDLNISCSNGSPEIQDLYASFDQLVRKLNDTLESLVIERQQKEDSELKALQAQINPHFLYNTLDSVVWVAETGDIESVIEIIIALSKYYQIVLSKGVEMIEIKKELEHVENYLIIMQKRYFDILNFELNIDTSVFDYKIPKMTLQPLVENAIYHGIKKKNASGKVTISINKIDSDLIKIRIIDNGAGMNAATLDKLTDALKAGKDVWDVSYGMINVERRIKLYYGPKYGLEVTSHVNEGTVVEIVVPALLQKALGGR